MILVIGYKSNPRGFIPLENTFSKKRQKSLRDLSYIKGSLTGFTLIELLIVGMIISILLTVSYPVFNKVYRQIQLQSITRQITATLRYAHQTAITEQTEFKVNYEIDTGKYWVEAAGNPISNSLLKPRVLPEGIAFERLTANAITFYPNGLADNFKIYLRNKEGQIFTILVDGFTGGIKVFNYEYQQI